MATCLLLYTKEYEKSIIVRTRDQDILDQLDIICDVGKVFDVEKRRFDHHQVEFDHHWWEDKWALKKAEEETKELQRLEDEKRKEDEVKGEPMEEEDEVPFKVSIAGVEF